MKKRLLFIYNPHSGKGQIRNCLMDIIDIFTKGGYEVIAYPTQGAHDGSRVLHDYKGSVDLVVCAGGDGTLDEVVDGLMNTDPSVPLGYIPAGSTNDFGSSLGISKDPVKAAGDIMDGAVVPCDIGSFGGKSFVYIAAFGLFTDVAYQTDQKMKNVLGHAAYLIEAGKRIFRVPTVHLRVQADEQTLEHDFVYGMITNARFVGGMKNLPGKDVDLHDGLFEIRLVYPPANPIELSEIVTTLLNPNLSSKLVLSFKASKILIESDEEVPWTLDGEYGGEHQKILIENRHKALNLVINEQSESE